MKKLFVLLFAGILVACNGNDESAKPKTLDPFTKMNINVRSKLSRSDYSDKHLTPLQIIQQAQAFQQYQPGDEMPRGRGIADSEKDFQNLLIRMRGSDIVRDGKVETYWRDARDLIILGEKGDTIAYIPQHVRNKAFEIILEAEKRQDFDLIYKTFQEAFTAVPCTHEEYKELKEKGLN